MISKPEAILFDWDDTLIHSLDIIHRSLATTFTKMGLRPYSKSETKYRVHRSMREEFPELFGKRWQEAADIYLGEIKKNKSSVMPIEGAEQILEHLKKFDELYVAVVSNKSSEMLNKEIDELGWRHYFSNIVGAGDAELDKPSPYPVKLALTGSDLEINKNHMWFIGDSITDMECAHNSSCAAILYGEHDVHSQIFKDSFHGFHPNKVVANFTEFRKLFDQFYLD